jgi:carbon monoxide dehydrogenase subunit G
MGMRFTNSFAVAAPPDKAWDILLDVSRIAPCVPGAELTEITDATHFKGKARVKAGPIELAFAGQAQFTEIDSVNRKARLVAKGNDTRGRGQAAATIDFELMPEGSGSRVTASTDLTMTGAIAQYGRGAGVMTDIANHITATFARNLEALLAQEHAGSGGGATAAAAPARRAAPLSAFALLGVMLRGLFGRWFGKLFGGAKP